MKRLLCDKKFNILYSITAIILMWAVWLIAAACVKNEYLIPPVGESVLQFFGLFAEGFFWKALARTLLRTLIAFLSSFALAALCACAAAAFRPFGAFMRPVAAVFRTLPTMAVLLLILVLPTRTTGTAPVIVADLVLFPMIYSQLFSGIEEVPAELIEMARAYKLPLKKRLFSIYLPLIAPQVVERAGANLSFGIKIIISAEVMASTYTAIGGLMLEAQTYNLPRLAALTLVAVLLGIVIEIIFRLISRRAFVWKRGERQ